MSMRHLLKSKLISLIPVGKPVKYPEVLGHGHLREKDKNSYLILTFINKLIINDSTKYLYIYKLMKYLFMIKKIIVELCFITNYYL